MNQSSYKIQFRMFFSKVSWNGGYRYLTLINQRLSDACQSQGVLPQTTPSTLALEPILAK